MISPSLMISLLSFMTSVYALLRRGPQGPPGARGEQGLKGDVGDTGARGPQGEPGEKPEIIVVSSLTEDKPKFSEEARQAILDRGNDPEFLEQVDRITKLLRKGSGLIQVDQDAQTNPKAFRSRHK